MICRLTGRVVDVQENRAVLAVGDVCYEVWVSGAAAVGLAQGGPEASTTLYTLQIFEGNAAVGSLTPRLYGFRSPAEREFCQLLTRVKGVSLRKALRALAIPVGEFAAAIERGDVKLLTSLPEVGKKSAQQFISDLRDEMPRFMTGEPVSAAIDQPALTEIQRLAIQILVQWGDRPADAQRWVRAAVEQEPTLAEPDAIVAAAYRVKSGAGVR